MYRFLYSVLKNYQKKHGIISYLNSVNHNPKERIMKRILGTLLFGATAFAGGAISALLLSPKSGKVNRRWVSKQGKKTKGMLEERGRKLKEDSEKRIDRLSKGVKKTLKDSVPNLYEATENLHFSEEEEVEEITKHG